eukprot:TRINITY_DN232_c0_g2_i1.p1 TRINITY_DN232_c0_g2~~TRINITY_DN232_c0_g2_i1.p1  ORF type:complete len:138 (-),score=23.32 TRINITY_DN232_c0_g2_i1:255-668(-)
MAKKMQQIAMAIAITRAKLGPDMAGQKQAGLSLASAGAEQPREHTAGSDELTTQLRIKVVASARKEGIEWMGDQLKVKVRAAPEKGRANTAVEELLAERLALPANSVKIVAGFTSPLKTLEIHSFEDLPALRRKLSE